jgi:hypothetical protein
MNEPYDNVQHQAQEVKHDKKGLVINIVMTACVLMVARDVQRQAASTTKYEKQAANKSHHRRLNPIAIRISESTHQVARTSNNSGKSDGTTHTMIADCFTGETHMRG